MKKSALATGALALGGSAVGTAATQETPDDDELTPVEGDGGTQGVDHVLLLYPDAVEEAEFTVVSGELDWSPVGAGTTGMGTPTPDGGGTPAEGETPTPAGGGQNYRTHVIQYSFSSSHVAVAFVPEDADVEEGGNYQLGEIEAIVRDPGQSGSGVLQGEPTYVRVGLQGGTDEDDAETPVETPEATPEETPDGTPTEEDGGIFD